MSSWYLLWTLCPCSLCFCLCGPHGSCLSGVVAFAVHKGGVFSSVSGRVTILDARSLFRIIAWSLKLKTFTWKALGYEVKGFGKGSKINKKWRKLFWQRDISYVSKAEGEEGVTVRSQGSSRVPHLVCEMTGFSRRGAEEDGWTWRCCIERIVWILLTACMLWQK